MKYKVEVIASQLYYQEIEVEAESPEDATDRAKELSWAEPYTYRWIEIDDGFETTDAEIITWNEGEE